MKYQNIAIWRVFLPKTKNFSYLVLAYPPTVPTDPPRWVSQLITPDLAVLTFLLCFLPIADTARSVPPSRALDLSSKLITFMAMAWGRTWWQSRWPWCATIEFSYPAIAVATWSLSSYPPVSLSPCCFARRRPPVGRNEVPNFHHWKYAWRRVDLGGQTIRDTKLAARACAVDLCMCGNGRVQAWYRQATGPQPAALQGRLHASIDFFNH
jgi:hypothetical protein